MAKKKILVIDDDDMNLQIAKMVLERKLPCEVICASSGVEGLNILKAQKVHLILLDILMPMFDGIETLQEIRDNPQTKTIPVMMLTATSDVEKIKKVAELGVKEYIRKPFMPLDLVNRVGRKLAETHAEEILIVGDDKIDLRDMRTLIEENFPHEVITADSFEAAKLILDDSNISLVVACADMKLVNGLRIMKYMAANEKFKEIPFALTTPDKVHELITKLNEPDVIKEDKKKIANVVTTDLGK